MGGRPMSAQVFVFSVATMNLGELRAKVLNNDICRLCLGGSCDGPVQLDDELPENHQRPRELIEKFHLIELNSDIPLDMICNDCSTILESFYKLHLTAMSSQGRIEEALSLGAPEGGEDGTLGAMQHQSEVDVEFINEAEDERPINQEVSSNEEDDDKTSFRCTFCSKNYQRKAHLERHVLKCHTNPHLMSENLLKASYCTLCGKKFTQVERFKDHMENISCVSHDNPECRFCNEIFTDIPQLEIHLKASHPKGREHFCSICFKSFPTVSNRNSHQQSHNPENTEICSKCNRGFKSILYLRKHEKTVHTKAENTCNICDKRFDTQQKFDYHLKSHESVKRYKCNHDGCDKSFMQFHHLENHKTTHTHISKYLCFKCGKGFRQECNLKSHLKIHDGENDKTFKCEFPDCQKSFKKNSSLRSHKNSHKDCQSSQCPECGKKFSQRTSLRAHFQTHFRDPHNRPFKCNQPGCDRSFYQERSVKYHNSSAHKVGEPIVRKASQATFICDFCAKSFNLQSLLKRHILIHVEEEQLIRKHKCDKCEAIFKRPEHLRLHINSVHLKFKPYRCEHIGCDKSFTQIGDRNVHMKIHLDVKPHACSKCQKTFRLKKALRAHEKVHNSEKTFGRQKSTALPETSAVYVGVNDQQNDEGENVFPENSQTSQIVFLLN